MLIQYDNAGMPKRAQATDRAIAAEALLGSTQTAKKKEL